MNIMTKRGSLDNIVTYTHICDTTEDLQAIDPKYSTLGSVALVIKGTVGLETYMANSDKEWVLIGTSQKQQQNDNPSIDTPTHYQVSLLNAEPVECIVDDDYEEVSWNVNQLDLTNLPDLTLEQWKNSTFIIHMTYDDQEFHFTLTSREVTIEEDAKIISFSNPVTLNLKSPGSFSYGTIYNEFEPEKHSNYIAPMTLELEIDVFNWNDYVSSGQPVILSKESSSDWYVTTATPLVNNLDTTHPEKQALKITDNDNIYFVPFDRISSNGGQNEYQYKEQYTPPCIQNCVIELREAGDFYLQLNVSPLPSEIQAELIQKKEE